jgi:hypothetical protein
MKKLLKKGVLLFAGVMAVCAFAMPAMSSAASWGVVGTEHTLHSANFGFTTTHPMLGAISSSCAESTFTLDVRNAAALTITNASLKNCTSSGPNIGDCAVTTIATTLPWTATGVTTSNVQIHDIRIDWRFETKPGGAAGSCTQVNGESIVLTGTWSGGAWNAAQHEVIYNSAELTAHGFTFGIDNVPWTTTGTIRDTAQSLTLT